MSITASNPRRETNTQVQSSDLSRNPAAVFHAAELGQVTITRRDGETLILESKAVADERQEVLQIASALIGIAVSSEVGDFQKGLAGPFPWVNILSFDEQKAFCKDLVETARASFAVNQHQLLIGSINGWRATAEAYAAGFAREPIDWLAQSEEADSPHQL